VVGQDAKCLLWIALVAQLDRASDFESEGREFESLRARQRIQRLMAKSYISTAGPKSLRVDSRVDIARPA
jgi:hypothetical protein